MSKDNVCSNVFMIKFAFGHLYQKLYLISKYRSIFFNIYNHINGMVLKLFFISIISVLKNRMSIDVIKSSLIKNNNVACVSFLHLEKIDDDFALNSDFIIEKNGQKYFMLIDNGYIYGGSRVPDFFN